MQQNKNSLNIVAGIFFILTIPALVYNSFFTKIVATFNLPLERYWEFFLRYFEHIVPPVVIFSVGFLLIAIGLFARKPIISAIGGFVIMLFAIVAIPTIIRALSNATYANQRFHVMTNLASSIMEALFGLSIILFGLSKKNKKMFGFISAGAGVLLLILTLFFEYKSQRGLLFLYRAYVVALSIPILTMIAGSVLMTLAFSEPSPATIPAGGRVPVQGGYGSAPTGNAPIGNAPPQSGYGYGSAPTGFNRPAAPSNNTAPAANGNKQIFDELERVASLHNQGILSDAEFEKITGDLLAKL